MGLCLQLEVRLATEEVDSGLASGHQFQPSKAELGGPGRPSILGRTPTPSSQCPVWSVRAASVNRSGGGPSAAWGRCPQAPSLGRTRLSTRTSAAHS